MFVFFAGNGEGIEALAKPIFVRGVSPFNGSGTAAPFNGSALPPLSMETALPPLSMEAAPPSPSMDATLPSAAPVNGANAPIRAARSSIVGGSFFVGILKRIEALAKPILARKCAASTAGAPHTPVYGMRPALSGLANSSFCRRLRLCRSRILRSASLCTCRRKSF